MVLSRIRSFFSLNIIARLGFVLAGVGVAVLSFAREVIAVAFPLQAPRDLIEAPPAAPRVLGLPSLRAFRDSLLSRMGDGRERSPLSVAFVT